MLLKESSFLEGDDLVILMIWINRLMTFPTIEQSCKKSPRIVCRYVVFTCIFVPLSGETIGLLLH